MASKLLDLSKSDISARCSDASLERGWNYYKGGAVRQRTRAESSIEARVAGTHVYRVTIRETTGGLATMCTCPYDWGGDCKHIVATLLAWVHEPGSFRAAGELQTALVAHDKEHLVSILSCASTIAPGARRRGSSIRAAKAMARDAGGVFSLICFHL